MKRGALILLSMLVTIGAASAQTWLPAFEPSYFYTSGNYSNDIRSQAHGLYGACVIRAGDYVDAGYEAVGLDHPTWTYDQSLIVAGGGMNFYPLFLQAHYARLSGKFSGNGYDYSYRDRGNIFNLVSTYNWDLFYFGISYSFLTFAGSRGTTSHQGALRVEWLVSPSVILAASPLYSWLSDGRNLYSLSLRGSFFLASDFSVHLTAAAGERAYYFHPDLLTLYNQNETQRTVLGARCDYQAWVPVKLVASFQRLSYAGYTINSVTLGVNALLSF